MAAQHFGPYRLEEMIGHGAMGEVYRAYDTVRNRTVALKRLPLAMATDTGFQTRFRRESALAARLGEPHIIPIHDYGEIDGQLFIDMRLVDGHDLAAIIFNTGPLTVDRGVSLIGQIALAIDAAHADGLIHRDVKPSNVLVTGDANDEFAYLIDFGISRATDAGDTSLTATGAAIGTLAYMAPERFLGLPIDGRVDVYSLGCMLFELLTGTPPFGGGGPALIHSHLHVDPPQPSAHRPGIPRALDQVVARSMAKDTDQRYSSAGELAAAARSAMQSSATTDPIRSAPPSTARKRETITVRVPEAVTAVRIAPRPVSSPYPGAESPQPAKPSRRRIVVIAAVSVAVVLAGGAYAMSSTGRLPTRAPHLGPTVSATLPVLAAYGLAVSPNTTNVYVTNLGQATVSVLDTATGTVRTTVPVGERPIAISLAPDGTQALVANANSDSVSVIDTATDTTVATIPVGQRPVAVAFSPDGRHGYAANLGSGNLSVIDTSTRKVVSTINLGHGPSALAVSPTGDRVYVANASAHELEVVDTSSGSVTARVPVSGEPADVATTPDGRRAVVTIPASSNVAIVDLVGAAPIVSVPINGDPEAVAIDPSGAKAYVVNDATSTVSVLAMGTDTVTTSFTVGSEPAEVAVGMDGRHIYVANHDSGTVSIVESD